MANKFGALDKIFDFRAPSQVKKIEVKLPYHVVEIGGKEAYELHKLAKAGKALADQHLREHKYQEKRSELISVFLREKMFDDHREDVHAERLELAKIYKPELVKFNRDNEARTRWASTKDTVEAKPKVMQRVKNWLIKQVLSVVPK